MTPRQPLLLGLCNDQLRSLPTFWSIHCVATFRSLIESLKTSHFPGSCPLVYSPCCGLEEIEPIEAKQSWLRHLVSEAVSAAWTPRLEVHECLTVKPKSLGLRGSASCLDSEAYKRAVSQGTTVQQIPKSRTQRRYAYVKAHNLTESAQSMLVDCVIKQ
jgi:hypothetical protein